jgi:SAM-dependent methyltransferase
VIDQPYYRADLARIHHLGFAHHADDCAPGILRLLEPVRERHGVVLEIGCGSGLLTRHLIDAGHRVIATDASPAMLDLAHQHLPPGTDVRQLTLPDDSIPEVEAIVGVGHALNYLPSEASIGDALVSMAQALRVDGVLAIDVCDLEWGRVRRGQLSRGWLGDDWAIVTHFSMEGDTRYIRQMATFTENGDGNYRRDDERHDNVLIDAGLVPRLLAGHGVDANVCPSFGDERLPDGLVAIVGTKPASATHARTRD